MLPVIVFQLIFCVSDQDTYQRAICAIMWTGYTEVLHVLI